MQRRAPIINRGYFTRVAAIHELIAQFLAADFGERPTQVPVVPSLFLTSRFACRLGVTNLSLP